MAGRSRRNRRIMQVKFIPIDKIGKAEVSYKIYHCDSTQKHNGTGILADSA